MVLQVNSVVSYYLKHHHNKRNKLKDKLKETIEKNVQVIDSIAVMVIKGFLRREERHISSLTE